MSTVRCTMAQALVRYLCNQFTIVDGKKVPLFPGVFAIFGHGNVTCLSVALEAVKDVLPTWRGQNEQSMALAAIGFAKAKRRRQMQCAPLEPGTLCAESGIFRLQGIAGGVPDQVGHGSARLPRAHQRA